MHSPTDPAAPGNHSDLPSKPGVFSLVPLLTPVSFASAFVWQPPQHGEAFLRKLHASAATRIEALRDWTQTFEAPRDQFTEVGYKVFDAFFQSFVDFLCTEWGSQSFYQTQEALRASIAALRQAKELDPLLIARATSRPEAIE